MRRQDGVSHAAWKPPVWVRSGLRGAVDLIWPPTDHDGAPAASPGLAPEAWSRIVFIADPVCDGCGSPFPYDLGPGARCGPCQAKPRGFARARAACLYDEASRDLVIGFKRADRLELAGLFARWLSRAAADLIAEADAIVPVPLHPWRLLSRRFNQAAEIARPLARLSGRAYLPGALARKRDTRSQAGRSGSGRRRNVAGAFVAPNPRQVAGKTILLIDDVLTTGATAEGCARALLAAGAARVNLAVIARVQDS